MQIELTEDQIGIFNDGFVTYETVDEFKKFAADDTLAHYAMLAVRPGCQEFLTNVEMSHYKPRTPRNDLFSIRFFIWSDLVWFVMSVPFNERMLVESVMGSCGLRVADGVPTMIANGQITTFMITGDNVFTIENVSDHPVYRNDNTINAALRIAENDAAERIGKGGKVPIN